MSAQPPHQWLLGFFPGVKLTTLLYPEPLLGMSGANVGYISMIHSIIFMSQLCDVDSFVFGPFSNFISYSDLYCTELVMVKEL